MGELKPEQKVELILWDWLKTKGENVREVYFNSSKNVLNWKYFKVKGEMKKPDLIVLFDTGYNLEYIAIEVKDNNSWKNILDGGKILDIYYQNYLEGKTTYYIDDKEIKINSFVVATQSSPKGYLYPDEKFIPCEESKSKEYVANIGLIPKVEGEWTHQYVRDLWARTNRLFDKYDFKEKPSIGVLIADEEIKPRIMIKKWINYLSNKKAHWGQRFIRL